MSAQKKRKILSLDEARALFTKDAPSSSPKSPSKGRSFEKATYQKIDKTGIQKQISRLEQRIFDEALSADEEAALLKEIERLERQL